MALNLKIVPIYTSYTDFVFEEVSDWGVNGNINRSDVTSANITIWSVNQNNVTTLVQTYDVTNELNSTPNNVYLRFVLNYPNGEIIPDDTYFVSYVVSDNISTYTFTLYIGTWYNVQSKVMHRIALISSKLNNYPYNCCSTFIKETECLFMLMQTLIQSSVYGNINEFREILDRITNIINIDETWQLQ